MSGAIAQLVERLHGMQEVVGSIPTSSTIKSLSSRGLGHCPFTAATGVRIPVGTPYLRNLHRKMQVFFVCSKSLFESATDNYYTVEV